MDAMEYSKTQMRVSFSIAQLLTNNICKWTDKDIQKVIPLVLGDTNWIMLDLIAMNEYSGTEKEIIQRFIENVYTLVTENAEKYSDEYDSMEVIEWQN